MYSVPPSFLENVENIPPKDLVSEIAQRFFDHFSSMHLNEQEWIDCLERFLASLGDCTSVGLRLGAVRNKISKIISDDKHIFLDCLSENARRAIFREVAEWLVAEKISEKIIQYESDIKNGLEVGRYKPIKNIEIVSFFDDEDQFSDESLEEIINFIQNNYVVDINGPIVGKGMRVKVVELKPIKFPLPYPEKNELFEGLRIKIPNRYLVLRLSLHTYINILGCSFSESEKNAVKSFDLATKSLFFQHSDLGNQENLYNICDECVDNEKNIEKKDDESLTGVVSKRSDEMYKKVFDKRYSFIPPSFIINGEIGNNSFEYITIQKKIIKEGEVLGWDKKMIKDFVEIPGFRDKVKLFVKAVKRFYAETGLIPDLVGNGNVLYTKKGNVYLVDINNITPKPDLRLIALFCAYRDLGRFIESTQVNSEKYDLFVSERDKTLLEIKDIINSQDVYSDFRDEKKLNFIISNLYLGIKDNSIRSFLRSTRLIDDLNIPIHFYNLNNLAILEMNIFNSEFDEGIISDEDREKLINELSLEEFYRSYSSRYGVWENLPRCLDRDYVIMNKIDGFDNWISDYVCSFVNLVDSNSSVL